jgi:methionyl-tRNA formyltransferase
LWGRLERRQLAELMQPEEETAAFPKHVRVYLIPQVASAETERVMREARLDVLFVMCKEMLPKRILSLPQWGVIGQHPGMTPHYLGSWSAFWALANGEPEMVGASVFVMDEKADTGPVIYQERVPIDPARDTFYSLTIKAEMLSATLMCRALVDLRNGNLQSREIVSDRKRTYFGVPGLTDFLRYGARVSRSIARIARE